jgi:hypothetical protein
MDIIWHIVLEVLSPFLIFIYIFDLYYTLSNLYTVTHYSVQVTLSLYKFPDDLSSERTIRMLVPIQNLILIDFPLYFSIREPVILNAITGFLARSNIKLAPPVFLKKDQA